MKKCENTQEKQQARRDLHRALDAVLDIIESQEGEEKSAFLTCYMGDINHVDFTLYQRKDRATTLRLGAELYERPLPGELTISELADQLEKLKEQQS